MSSHLVPSLRNILPVALLAAAAASCADLLGIEIREVRACAAQSVRCEDGLRQVCAEDGSGWLDEPCGESERCIAEQGVVCVAHDPIASLSHGEAFAHACALTQVGKLVCWGLNNHGQLGKTASDGTNAPAYVELGEPVAQVSTGFGHSCVRTVAGRVLCFGENDVGQVDPGFVDPPDAVAQFDAPHEVDFAAGALDVRASADNTCAVMPPNATTNVQHVLCWGANNDGELGDAGAAAAGPLVVDTSFVDSAPLFAEIGERHACALHESGHVTCWGLGVRTGLVGVENPVLPHVVEYLAELGAATSLSVGDTHSLAIVDGAAHCFGGNGDGQCDGRSMSDVQNGTLVANDIERVSSGWRHSCIVSDGPEITVNGEPTIFCYGRADRGTLGTTDAFGNIVAHGLSEDYPIDPPWDGLILDLTTPFEFSCALAITESVPTVYCWGGNDAGQCGVEGGDVLVPTQIDWPVE